MNDTNKLTSEYDFKKIEKKWQTYWLANKTFRTLDQTDKPKFYVLDMFPYPSGNGLHVGHPEGYTATDIISRYKRMNGVNVLHPMGWDAFGLPAEQHAIKTGTHPADTTKKNIDRFREQIRSLGLSYDWDREIDTTDPKYYKWTQWIFAKLYERGLAYQSYEYVNWCPALGTVLANEEVVDGLSEVGGHPVEKKKMRQWVLKITEYAERLLQDLDDLDWPESVKEMQRNWIGKSLGASVRFSIQGQPEKNFQVFTTRPDTLFGATFCVLAPEHPLIGEITSPGQKHLVESYITETMKKSDLERTSINKEKTGVATGGYAINPVNGSEIPIYIADYVLMGYGTGAIMAVPGHDERDHEFALAHRIDILRVITGGEEQDIRKQAHTGDGILVNSGFLNGLTAEKAFEMICRWLEEQSVGKKTVTYRLKDWLFSRQRYWGEPFPIVHDQQGKAHLTTWDELPIVLPEMDDFQPTGTGEPPLAKAGQWLNVEMNGISYKRETNTMPQWAGSCWYYLRYIDPHNDQRPWDKEKENYWMPVDLYVGGVEHAVLHLLYSRFWHKVLYDIGEVSTKEPFQKLVNQGMILGSNGEKMSKSRGNVVNPDDVTEQYGADSLRLYEMFMGPFEAVKPWQTNGIIGVHRFLKRVWKLLIGEQEPESDMLKSGTLSDEAEKQLHKTIQKVSDDIENFRFNTAISAMMEFVNQCYKDNSISKDGAETLTLLLSPFAPHIAEELWQRLGHDDTLAYHPWPQYDPLKILSDLVTMAVMINGKVRGSIEVDKNWNKDMVIEKAKQIESVAKQLAEKTIAKVIFVQHKIVNFVVNS